MGRGDLRWGDGGKRGGEEWGGLGGKEKEEREAEKRIDGIENRDSMGRLDAKREERESRGRRKDTYVEPKQPRTS